MPGSPHHTVPGSRDNNESGDLGRYGYSVDVTGGRDGAGDNSSVKSAQEWFSGVKARVRGASMHNIWSKGRGGGGDAGDVGGSGQGIRQGDDRARGSEGTSMENMVPMGPIQARDVLDWEGKSG